MQNSNQQQGRRPCFSFLSRKPPSAENNVGVRHKILYLIQILVVSCSVLLVLCFLTLIFFGIKYVFSVSFQSKLHSFSITSSSSNSSKTTNYDIVFSVTSKYCDSIGVNPAKVSIFYKKQRVCEKHIDPFDLFYSIEKKIHLNFSTPPLPDWVASDVGFEKARNGTLSFGFSLEAVGNIYETNRLFEISCGYFKTGFSSNSSLVQLIKAPKKCMVEIDGREQ